MRLPAAITPKSGQGRRANVKSNVIANIAGNVWVGLMGLAFVPIYIRFIGVEGYGLIGFFAVLTSLLMTFDAGFGAAAARELARISHTDPTSVSQTRNLVRTLEVLFWIGALLVGALIVAFAPIIANRWLDVGKIGLEATIDALHLMGCIFAIQCPLLFYNGCLMGLQRQVSQSVLGAVAATLKGVGSALILWLVSPTIQAFFIWQLTVVVANAMVARQWLWHVIPDANSRPSFEVRQLRRVHHFARGVGGIYVLNVVMTQLDKVVVSNVLSLEDFGRYMLASTLASLLLRIAGPVFNAIYPRLTQLLALGDATPLIHFYHRSGQLMAFVVVPLGLLLVFFGEELIALWTRSSAVAEGMGSVVAILAIGMMATGLMSTPGALLLAHGRLGSVFGASIVALIAEVPLTYFLAGRWGLQGAASAALVLTCSYNLFFVFATRALLPRDEGRRWYKQSFLFPVAAAFGVYALLLPGTEAITVGRGGLFLVAVIVVNYGLGTMAVALALPESRQKLLGLLKIRRAKSGS